VSLASNHVVVAIAPSGLLTRIAGTGSGGFNGDGSLATDAMIYGPRGLAFDPVANKLYIADMSNARIRVVDFATGFINTVAGGGSAGGPMYGDGPALAATLSNPGHIRLHGGSLFISDTGHARVRQLDLGTNLVSTVVYNSSGCGTAVVNLLDCTGEYGCDTAWDSTGRLYVSGDWCGNPMGGNYVQGVIRIDPGPVLVPVVGVISGTQGEGVLGTATYLPTSGALAFDGADNLYLTLSGSHVIRTLRSSDQRVYTWAGTNGSPGYAGDYTPVGSGTLFNYPWDLLLSGYGGHAVIADENNNVVRVIW
jgi:DNA-binding beta-propeller fold protein YncE